MIEQPLIQKIVEFAGDVPAGLARVLIYEEGKFLEHGDLCRLNYFTGTGRLINARCVGARARSPKGRVFVVWKNGKPNPNVKEYEGVALFPNFQQLPN